MNLELRQDQITSVEDLRAWLRTREPGQSKRQLLYGPTGFGKTVISTFLMQEADRKGTRSAFIVDRVALVDQTSRMFDEYGIAHGVIQANHYRLRPWERTQICSIHTLRTREFPGDLKLIFVDEAHTKNKAIIDFMNTHPDVVVIGLSATPFTKGLGKIYDNIVSCTTTDKLIADGFLAPLKPYAAKKIDMAGARTKFDGEWNDEDIEKRAMVIIGDVVQCWREKTTQHFNGPVKTLVFSASVAHGEELCRKFQEAGFNFQQISYKDSNDEGRAKLISEFRKSDSEIVGLVSCEALAKGFDVPDVQCMVSCRPYRKSLSAHIQQIGRGMRSSPGKEFCLLLDHSQNYLRFMDDMVRVFADGVHDLNDSELDSKVRKEPEQKEHSNSCESCGYILAKADLICPSCGTAKPKRQNDVLHVPGEMVEVTTKKKQVPEYLKDKDQVWRQICHEGIRRKQGDTALAERWAKAQYRSLYDEWPRFAMRNVTPEAPSYELHQKLRSMMIRYAKSKAKQSPEARA